MIDQLRDLLGLDESADEAEVLAQARTTLGLDEDAPKLKVLAEVRSLIERNDESTLVIGGREYDEDKLRSIISDTIGGDGDGEAVDPPELETPGERGLDVNGDVKIEQGELENEGARAEHTLKMLNALNFGRHGQVRENIDKLIRGGHYGETMQRNIQTRGVGDYYQTLVGDDGQVLLPTVVREEIEEIAQVYGVARQLVQTFNHVVGTIKIPGGSGETPAVAIGEGQAYTADKRAFEAVQLNPQKWGKIIPWTYEANREIGPQILMDVQRSMARGFAKAEDDALINGDGTSSYHGIEGIFNLSGTSSYTLTEDSITQDEFDEVHPDDIILAKNNIAPGARDNVSLIAHPDMEAVFKTKKDDQGAYLFDYNSASGIDRVGGIPVFYTEVLPANSTGSQGSTNYMVLGNFSYWKMAIGEEMSTEQLRESTITDVNGNTINLGEQDIRANKFREFFDMGTNFPEVFVPISTAA